MHWILASLLVGFWQTSAAPAESGAEVRFQDGSLKVVRLAPDLLGQVADSPALCANLLGVWTGKQMPAAQEKRPQVAGRCRVQDGELVFDPRYPWTPGVDYVAVWRGSDVRRPDRPLTFSIPKPDLPRHTRVTAIHPGSDTLPMNLLRIYIHFSHSMSRGQAYRHIRLVDDQGQTVPNAFLDLRPELWDPATRRFTLLFDPGRIKRGLDPHKQLGLPLYPDRSYRLVISADWEDGRGVPLLKGFEKSFTVAPPDRTSPQPELWQLGLPAPGTREPLRVRFGEPLDHALAIRLIRVERSSSAAAGSKQQRGTNADLQADRAENVQSRESAAGHSDWETVQGRIEMQENDRVWSFRPDSPWPRGDHRLSIGAWLEDLAGNNLNRPFDYDLESRQQIHGQKRVYVPFRVTP